MQQAYLVFELRYGELIGGTHLLDVGGDFGGGRVDGAANHLDVIAGSALVETVQLSFQTGLEVDFAFVDGAGEGFNRSRGGLHLSAKPFYLFADLVSIVLELGIERGLNCLQIAGP